MSETPSSEYQPCILDHLVGQQKVRSVLRTHLDAYWNDRSAGRNPVLGHMLFAGPPGVGKTQVANTLATELLVPLVTVTADSLANAQQTHRLLMELEPSSILFLDEIHALARYPASETIMLRALAEGKICLGGGKHSKPTTVDLPAFTCIGATTDPWSLHPALVQRFSVLNFDFYTVQELAEIARRRAKVQGIDVDPGVFDELAQRAKQTPRICLALLTACYRTARSENSDTIRLDHVTKTLAMLEIDDLGLDLLERRYLGFLKESGCVRLNVLAQRMGLPVATIKRMVEPFLVRQGLIVTTDKGRELTAKGLEYLTNPAQE